MAGYFADRPNSPPFKVIHIIGSLGVGGAEVVLERIVMATRQAGVETVVVTLTDVGPIGKRLEAHGIKVIALGVRARSPGSLPSAALRLRSLLRHERPAVVQTWLYHADLFGGLLARLSGHKAIVWSVHSTDLSHGTAHTTRWLRVVLARLSAWIPACVVYVADSARVVHENLGYAKQAGLVIYNGFDTNIFKPDAASRTQVRDDLGIPRNAQVIGSFGRFNRDKDHETFFKAAQLVLQKHPATRFLLAGTGVLIDNDEIAQMMRTFELPSEAIHLLGQRDDIPTLMRAVDVYCLHSRSEAFPLALGEAMASGAVPVVTNVGDAALLVQGVGTPVPPENPHALFQELDKQLCEPEVEHQRHGQLARQRIIDEFSLAKMVRKYMDCYQRLIAERH
jgi:glycosyltransferase involved in cell wall biosynthesis